MTDTLRKRTRKPDAVNMGTCIKQDVVKEVHILQT